MKKFIVTFVSVAIASVSSFAQNNLVEEYEKYRQQTIKRYADFRDECNGKYVEFLKQAWEYYKAAPVIPMPKEEVVPPVVIEDDREKTIDDKKLPYDEVIPAPVVEPQPQPIEPVKPQPVIVETWFEFPFFNTAMKVRVDDSHRFELASLDGNDVSKVWEQLMTDKYDNMLVDCLKIRDDYQLCDWAYLLMLLHFSGEFLQSENVNKEQIDTIMAIEDLFGSVDILKEASNLSTHPLVQKAIERLTDLYQVLCIYGVEKYVSFDLGMLSSYQYYTGIIFKVYTIGIGDVVVKGGRYDKLLPYFGKNSPAIGFVIVIDDLMQALKRQKIEIPGEFNHLLIVYDGFGFEEALKEAKTHRDKGVNVALMRLDGTKERQDYDTYAKNHGINQVIYLVK